MKLNKVGRKGVVNRLAGAKGYGRSKANKVTGRDYSKERAYQSSPEMIAYRVELNRKNRELIKKGKQKVGDGQDVSHNKSRKSGGTLKNGYRFESASKNRARK